MKNLILFDTRESHENLLPLSYTRPIAYFRVGILTIADKWRLRMKASRVSSMTEEYLLEKFPLEVEDDNLFVESAILPDERIIAAVDALSPGEALMYEDRMIAFRGSVEDFKSAVYVSERRYEGHVKSLRFVFDVFLENAGEIRKDFSLITAGRLSQPLSGRNLVVGSESDGVSGMYPEIFVEDGASIPGGVTFNVAEGPIYIGVGAEVMEGACVRGPFALGNNAKVNMGAKIYPGTTVGPYSKVGGELNNVVIFGYSNKAHDGFLGNAVIGEWCNIGAGTNASNLKNDYSLIRVWNYPRRTFMRTKLQFCGLIMGDHSKAGVNCMFNTATVIGVGVNFHGTGFPRPFIPSFQQGSCAGFTDVCPDKFFSVAEAAMARRGVALTEADRRIFHRIFTLASQYK